MYSWFLLSLKQTLKWHYPFSNHSWPSRNTIKKGRRNGNIKRRKGENMEKETNGGKATTTKGEKNKANRGIRR